jgi:transcription termination/antitermination protein NusA
MTNENREILNVVESLSNAKGVDKELIFEAIELALAAVTARRYDDEPNMKVKIDPATGSYQTFRRWEIVADDAVTEEEPLMVGHQLTLTKARDGFEDESLVAGEWVEELVDSVEFGRIAAQQAKQLIIQKVREAERQKIKETYSARMGELVMAVVKRVTKDFLVFDLGENAEALLPRAQMIPRESFRLNDRARILLQSIREETRGPHVLASRIAPEFIVELFKIEVPEISEEVIQIKSAARDPGMRAKIAVKTNDGRIDPVGACVGMRGSRVQAVSNEINGERVDIVLWDDNPAQFVINAMKPAEIASVVVDEDKQQMDIAVTEDQLSLAIGKGGQNVRLASVLTGWALNVMSEADAAKKHEEESLRIQQSFVDQLDVDSDIAGVLVREGFVSVESISYSTNEDLSELEGLDEDIAQEIISRANDVLLIAQLSDNELLEPAEDLLNLEGVTDEMATVLAKNGVITRDDLAEQSIDELQDIITIEDEEAGKLIMKAREHWFA